METNLVRGSQQTGSYAERHGITIALRRLDKVIGEMRTPPGSLIDGCVHPGALVGFACELVGIGASLHSAPDQSIASTQTQAAVLADCRSTLVSGESVLAHAAGRTMVWQTSLHDANGVLVAVVTQSRLMVHGGNKQSEPPVSTRETTREGKAKEQRDSRTDLVEDGAALPVAQIRRQQIVDAACEIIAQKGFANATIREIARAAGLHVPTMYQYIDSKEALLELVYKYAIKQLRVGLDQVSAEYPTSRERLRATVAVMIENGDRYRRQAGVLVREFKSLPLEAQQRIFQEYRGFLNQLADVISAGIEAGEFRPVNPFIMANVVEAICDIWALRQFAVREIGLQAVKDEIMNLIDASLHPGIVSAGGRTAPGSGGDQHEASERDVSAD